MIALIESPGGLDTPTKDREDNNPNLANIR